MLRRKYFSTIVVVTRLIRNLAMAQLETGHVAKVRIGLYLYGQGIQIDTRLLNQAII